MTELLSVWIPGNPKTKGSLSVINARRGVVRDSDASRHWRELMVYALRGAYGKELPASGPVQVVLWFFMPTEDDRVTDKGVGDIDKLCRNVLDALTDAGVYYDDTQVIALRATKMGRAVEGPGVRVSVLQ